MTPDPEHPVDPRELSPEDDRKLVAAITALRRGGARKFQLRYSDDEDPVVWMAIVEVAGGGHEVAASLHPVRAVLRLCERLGAVAKPD